MGAKRGAPSTVGRGRAVAAEAPPREGCFRGGGVEVFFGDSAGCYDRWDPPDVIVSDGAYGVLGFEGDTTDHLGMPAWYEPHIEAWSRRARPSTALWFWNTEIGWAAVHPVLERHGWRYVNANVWNKGLGHVAGNVNTAKIRRFPVVSEVCVQYVREVRLGGLPLKAWLLREWRRTGLPLREANRACGVADAATRKYLTQDHLWYWPPVEMFAKLRDHANAHGDPAGRPYFSADGLAPLDDAGWAATRSIFRCPHGVTNVWDRPPLHGPERITTPGGRAVHLNQKPLDLLLRLIDATSEPGSVVWEPFGGLFSTCVAALRSGRRAFGAEVDPTYYQYGVRRLRAELAGA